MWRHQSKDQAQGFVHSAQHPGTSWSLRRVLPESRLTQERRAGLEAPKVTPWYRVGGVHLVHPVRYKDNHGKMLSLVSIWSSRLPQSFQIMFRRLGRLYVYGNTTRKIAKDPDNWDDLGGLDRIEFYSHDWDDRVTKIWSDHMENMKTLSEDRNDRRLSLLS